MSRELRSYLMTTADIATALSIRPDLIHLWAHRGYLTRYGTPRAALWDIRELGRVINAQPGQRQRVA